MFITLIIVIVTGLVSYRAFEDRGLFHKFLFSPYLIFRKNQWFRIFTHGFIHADWTHLLINMLVLYSFGDALEMYYKMTVGSSGMLFLLTYFGGMVVAGIYDLIKHKDNAHYNAVGASGAVSAVTFACIVFAPMHEILFFMIIPMPGIVFAILYLAYSYYMGKQSNENSDNIAHNAHFYGAVYGFLFPIIVEPKLLNNFISQIF